MADRELIELSQSRGQIKADGYGDRSSAEIKFLARNCFDETDVFDLIESEKGDLVPDPYNNGTEDLAIRNIDITEQVNPTSWRVTVHYLGKPQTTYQYDFAAGTQHITNSLNTTAAHNAGFLPDSPDFKGAIGVDNDGNVTGVDKVQPSMSWKETHYYYDDEFTDDLIGVLTYAVGKVNNAEFEGTSAGETLFNGATAIQRESNLWEVTYNFSFSANLEDLVIGDIDGISKKGWEYLWVYYSKQADDVAGILVKQPSNVYIEQVYEEIDFSTLFPTP